MSQVVFCMYVGYTEIEDGKIYNQKGANFLLFVCISVSIN